MSDDPADASPQGAGEQSRVDTVTATREDKTAQRPQYAPPTQEEFDWRGWLLVCVVIVSFLVVPATILYLPHAQFVIDFLGIGYRTAYLTLPLVPAFLLGATAVWAAVRSRTE